MLLGTAWFVWNVNNEPIADFSAFKPYMIGGFHRGRRAVVHLCAGFSGGARAGGGAAAARQIDGGHRPAASGRIAVRAGHPGWAYVLVVAGIWFTITPWKLRDFVNWATATEARTRLLSGVRLAFAAFVRRLTFPVEPETG